MPHRQSRRPVSMRHTQAARRLGATIALILTVAACEADRGPVVNAPSAPTPPPAPPPPSPPSGVVSGTAYEFTATGERRPVPNLRLRVRAASASDGAVGGRDLPDVVTDGNGRYAITEATAFILFFTTAPGSDYRFLCDFFPLLTRPSPTYSTDLPLVHVSWSGDRLPPGMWSAGTSVNGIVSERVNGAVRPVAGATVTLDSGMPDPPATTNAAGFYMVCSEVGTDQYRTITARKDGYRETSRQIFGGWDFKVDLELARD